MTNKDGHFPIPLFSLLPHTKKKKELKDGTNITVEMFVCILPPNEFLYRIDMVGDFNKAIVEQLYQIIMTTKGDISSGGIISYEALSKYENKKKDDISDIITITFLKDYSGGIQTTCPYKNNDDKIDRYRSKFLSTEYVSKKIHKIYSKITDIEKYNVSMDISNNMLFFLLDSVEIVKKDLVDEYIKNI